MAKIVSWNEEDLAYQKRVNSRVTGGNGSQRGNWKRRRNPGGGGRSAGPAAEFMIIKLCETVQAAEWVAGEAGEEEVAGGLRAKATAAAAYVLTLSTDEEDEPNTYIFELDTEAGSGDDPRRKIAVLNPNYYSFVPQGEEDSGNPVFIQCLKTKAMVEITSGDFEEQEAAQLPLFDLRMFPGTDHDKTQVLFRQANQDTVQVGGKQCGTT